jgi:diguanylate cyclase
MFPMNLSAAPTIDPRMTRKDMVFLTLLPCLGSVFIGVLATKNIVLAGAAAIVGAVVALIVLGRANGSQRSTSTNLDTALMVLPDRSSFLSRVRETVAASDGTMMAALFVLDLHRLAIDDDELLHQAGDMMLAAVGPRLKGALRDNDLVGRLGYDEFAVLLMGVRGEADLLAVAERLVLVLNEPFLVREHSMLIEARIGAAIIENVTDDVAEVLSRADVALTVAKSEHADVIVYRPELEDRKPEENDLVVQLRHGIEAGELVLHYQPKFTLATGYPVGVECLVRWNHPSGELMPPMAFIPLAEQSAVIHSLTRAVLTDALRQCRIWLDRGWRLPVAINVSANCFLDRSFGEDVFTALKESNVSPDLLTLEVTESTFESDPGRVYGQLQFLRERGVTVALGEYGVGYSTLAKLKSLPIDELKIDRSLVANLSNGPHDKALVRAILDLGLGLGLTVVAEGAEDAETCEMLMEIGCEIAQGFQWMKPMPAAELDVFLHSVMKVATASTPTVLQAIMK